MIEVRGFARRYGNLVVRIPDFTTRARVCLVKGANGSGKTTLFKALAGLTPHEGVASVCGRALYVDEHPRFPDAMTPRAYLDVLGNLGAAHPRRVAWLIDAFHMQENLDKPFSALSKGMRQKTHLIASLGEKWDAYLLDEPTSGLDEAAVAMLAKVIGERHETYVIATHRGDAFEGVCEGVLSL